MDAECPTGESCFGGLATETCETTLDIHGDMETQQYGSTGLSGGAIAGIVIVTLLGVMGSVAAGYVMLCRRKEEPNEVEVEAVVQTKVKKAEV